MAASARRETRNTPGFATPVMDHGPVGPDLVERNEHNPRLMPAPEIPKFPLRPVEHFSLSVTGDSNLPRAVTEADLPELFEWGIPLYAERYPGVSIEGMLPLVRRAIMGAPYRAFRTADAFGIFMADQKPWMAAPEVFDICVAWNGGAIHQAVMICREAIKWARSIRASRFMLIECDSDLSALAERIGCKETSRNHSRVL